MWGVSLGVARYSRMSVSSAYTTLLVAAIAAWMIVASLAFSEARVRHLVLISALVVAGLGGHLMPKRRPLAGLGE
jgi:hypothetical protein